QVLGRIQCTTSCYRSCVLFFLQRTCPIHFFRPKTKFLGGFTRFCCREVQVVRSGFGVHKMQQYVLPKLRLVFSLRSCPIHLFRPKTKFLDGFVRFSCLEVPVVRSGFWVHTMHHFMLPKLRLVFSQRTCPIHFFRPKTMFLGGFARFRCREVQVVISGFGVHKMHPFVLPKSRLVFRNEHAKSASLGPKQCFWVVSRDSVAGRYKLLYRVLGCIKCTTLCFRSCFLFVRNEHAQSTS